MSLTPKDLLRKQLLYRSTHRGCKETDILLGKFITEKLNEFDDRDLNLYQRFIEEDDVLIYDWIMDKEKVDEDYLELVKEIRKFHRI